MTLKELREKRKTISAQIDAILDTVAKTDDGIMTAEQNEQIEAAETQLVGLDGTIKAMERAEHRTTAASQSAGRKIIQPDGPIGGDTRIEVGADLAATKPWASFGEFLGAVRDAGHPARPTIDPRLAASSMGIPSGLNEANDSQGGFLVMCDHAQQLLSRAYSTGQVVSRVFRIPLSSGANAIEIPAVDETSRADGSRYGGVQVYWADEAATVTATKPKFRNVKLKLNKLMGLCYITEELLQDTMALEAFINRAFSEEFGFKLDDACIRGNGAGQMLGILNSPCLVSVTKETGQAATTVVANNIIKMWSRIWAPSRGNAVWFIEQELDEQLPAMSLPVGTGGVSVYMPANGLSGSPFATLFGRPVVPIEQCSALGTVGDIILGDFSQFLMIDKGGLQAASSMHVRFIYDEMAYKFTYRCDGQPWWNSALTPKSGSSKTRSPFVVTATRS